MADAFRPLAAMSNFTRYPISGTSFLKDLVDAVQLWAPIVSEFGQTSMKELLYGHWASVRFGRSDWYRFQQLITCGVHGDPVMRVDAQQLVPFGDVPATEIF
jgi:hypothetical protein